MSKAIHIVAFDVPYPPNYGGIIDIFHKIRLLYESGIKITLHCFEYGRGKQPELEKYCQQVFYYKREKNVFNLLKSLPYIVASRSSKEVINNLLTDNSPILFEGLHCCYYLTDRRLIGRKKIVRMHNIEHKYYASLAQVEKSILKRIYFKSEARKLKKYEKNLQHADLIAAISQADRKELSGRYTNVTNISAFHPHDKIVIKEGKNDFVLYHGNLKVPENNKAALYLVNKVLNDVDIPFVIAGNEASGELRKAIVSKKHIQLKENISTDEMYTLVQTAHINILPTFQSTGIKLKLLASLYAGRFCLVNSQMVNNTGLEQLCIISDSPEKMKSDVKRLMQQEFTSKDISERETILNKDFSNKENVRKIIALL